VVLPLITREEKITFNILCMIPEAIKIASRDLRKNMTEAEVILWNILK
jgi:hypothetical protein